jgi:nitroreductase
VTDGLDVLEAIRSRRSVRAFTREGVSDEDVTRLIDAGRWAPSAGNIQPWEFVVATRPELKSRLSVAALDETFIEEAPLVIVVCADEARSARGYGSRGANLYCLQDTAAATQNILLAAHALGLGACWVGAFREDDVREVLKLPRHLRPVAIVPVGHPATRRAAPPKRSISEVIHYETF